MVENAKFKSKYLKYKLKYKKLVGGVLSVEEPEPEVPELVRGRPVIELMSTDEENEKKKIDALDVFYADFLQKVQYEIYNELWTVFLNPDEPESLSQLLENYIRIKKTVNPRLALLCKIPQFNYKCNLRTKDYLVYETYSWLYKLSKPEVMTPEESRNISDHPVYGKLFQKYKNEPWEGISLVDIFDIIDNYEGLFTRLGFTELLRMPITEEWGGPPGPPPVDEQIKVFKLLVENSRLLNINLTGSFKHPDHPDKFHILNWCARLNKIEFAKILIENNFNVNMLNGRPRLTPLHMSIAFSNNEIAKLLIKNKADLNIQGEDGNTPLHVATYFNNNKIAELLINSGADLNIQDGKGNTTLHYAIESKNTEMAKLLIEKGADLNIQNSDGTPLLFAISKNNTEIAKLLIEKGADVNISWPYCLALRDGTPLHQAIKKENSEIAKLLIEKGANVNMLNCKGETALILAASSNKIEIAKLLIEKGANVDMRNNSGETALFYTLEASSDKIEIAKLLIEAGVYLNFKNGEGRTPLHLTTMNHNNEIAKLLIQKGADLNIQDISGHSAYYYAIKENNTEIKNLLKEKGVTGSWMPEFMIA